MSSSVIPPSGSFLQSRLVFRSGKSFIRLRTKEPIRHYTKIYQSMYKSNAMSDHILWKRKLPIWAPPWPVANHGIWFAVSLKDISPAIFIQQKGLFIRNLPPPLFCMICSFSLEVPVFSCFFFNKISTALFFSGAMNFLCVQPPNSESVFEVLGVVLENTRSSGPLQWQTECVGSLAPQVSVWVFTRSSFSLTFCWNFSWMILVRNVAYPKPECKYILVLQYKILGSFLEDKKAPCRTAMASQAGYWRR